MRFRTQPAIADPVALSLIAQRDAPATRRSLHRRDRDRFLAWQRQADSSGWNPAEATATQRTLRWLDEFEDGRLRQRVASTSGWAWGIAVVFAAVVGVGAAMALFRYDGSRPINVLWVLAIFVVLPLITAVLSAIGMLIGWPKAHWMPGATLTNWLWRKLVTHGHAESSLPWTSLWQRHARVLSPSLTAHAWWVGQSVGLAFVAAGAATFALLLATSDLAFGWASTLNLEPAAVQRGLAQAFWFAPSLAPDTAMLEATVAERATPFVERYADHAEAFKAWWLPLLALLLVYGLVPRLALTLFAGWRQRRIIARAFASHPALQEIDARMTTPFVETVEASADHRAIDNAGDAAETQTRSFDSRTSAATQLWLRWADAPLPRDVSRADVLVAGGDATLEEDQRSLDVLARAASGAAIRIAVKAWEPPLAEFTDWLRILRKRLGDGPTIEVVAVMRDDHDRGAAHVWQRKLGQLADPWLRISVAKAGETP